MPFSLVLHLLFSSNVLPLFYEHCHYYSKKGAYSQEKNDSKLLHERHFSIFPGSKKNLFHRKCGYLDFLRFFIPYIVEKAVKLPFHGSPVNFSAQFFIAPVDNFCYTVKRRGALYAPHIPQVTTLCALCYPQAVDKSVYNFPKLCKRLLTFSSRKKFCREYAKGFPSLDAVEKLFSPVCV